MRLLYTLVAYLLLPLYAGGMLWRGRRERAWWSGFPQRLGFGPYRAGTVAGDALWVHAVSIGEVQAAAALVRRLREHFPGRPIVLTTVTPSGAARARALFGESVEVRYLPFDLPGPVRRFLDGVRPRLAIVLETEIWPNLFHACAARGIPVVLASARLSERSVRRYRRLRWLLRATLAEGVWIEAQSAADATRFLDLGAAPARTAVGGSLKFDLTLPPDILAEGRVLRRELAPGRPLWVAGSTHPGEETLLLAAHRRLRVRLPQTLLVLAPRHAGRFEEVAAWLDRQGVRYRRRATGEACDAGTEVLLLDTLGELVAFYAAADVAFVAGSLIPIGGHNLLEPAALGRAVLTGPHHFNAPDVFRVLKQAGAVEVVEDAAALAAALVALLTDPVRRNRMGERGHAAIERNRGSLARVLNLLVTLTSSVSSGRASR